MFNLNDVNRFAIYIRLFLVMFISWILFIVFDGFKLYVVTMMNGLHIIAFITMWDDVHQRNCRELLRTFNR